MVKGKNKITNAAWTHLDQKSSEEDWMNAFLFTRKRQLANLSLVMMTFVASAAHATSNVQIGDGPDTLDGNYINSSNLADVLAFTDVTVQATDPQGSISFVDPANLATTQFFGPTVFDLTLQAPTVNVYEEVKLGGGTLTMVAQTVNLHDRFVDASGNTLTAVSKFSGSASEVNVLSANASIRQAIFFADSGTAAFPFLVNVVSGTYNDNVLLNKSNVEVRYSSGVTINGGFNVDKGRFVVGGGTGDLTVTGSLAIGRVAGDTPSHTQTGGVMNVGSLSLGTGTGSAGTYNLQGGTLVAGAIDTVNAGTSTFNFTGGTLAVGTFIGNLVNNGGTLAPGASPGTTVVQGDYTQSAAGVLNIELGGTGAGQYDVLEVTSTATLGGELEVLFWNGFVAAAGDSFDIVTATTLLGGFDSLDLAALGGGLTWDVAYLYDIDVSGTDVVRLSVQAVPEPEAYAMMLAGLGLVGWATRRRNRFGARLAEQ